MSRHRFHWIMTLSLRHVFVGLRISPDIVMARKPFLRYWPFVWRITGGFPSQIKGRELWSFDVVYCCWLFFNKRSSCWCLKTQWHLWDVTFHYDDVIMGARRLKSPAKRLLTQPFIQTQIKENIKAPRHGPLCGEFTGDRWIPRTNGQ